MPRVVVDVMLKPEILDPQGQAVAAALPRLGVNGATSVRIGRRIELEFAEAPDPATVREIADRLLANPVIEDYTVHITPESGATTGGPARVGGGSASVDNRPGRPDDPESAERATGPKNSAGPERPEGAASPDSSDGEA